MGQEYLLSTKKKVNGELATCICQKRMDFHRDIRNQTGYTTVLQVC